MFKHCDVVRLKSGGPRMLVMRVQENGTVQSCDVTWFTHDCVTMEHHGPFKSVFPSSLLDLVPEAEYKEPAAAIYDTGSKKK